MCFERTFPVRAAKRLGFIILLHSNKHAAAHLTNVGVVTPKMVMYTLLNFKVNISIFQISLLLIRSNMMYFNEGPVMLLLKCN